MAMPSPEASLSPSMRDFVDGAAEPQTDRVVLELAPTHPSMRGAARLVLGVEGRTVAEADLQIGYLHRGFEKQAENATYAQIFPYVDRLNYASPLLNSIGFAMAAEKLLNVAARIPERAQYLRVVGGELSRMCDHLRYLAATAADLAGASASNPGHRSRELLGELLADICGTGLGSGYCRIGGVASDLPEDFARRCGAAITQARTLIGEMRQVVERSRTFWDRMEGVGTISREDAMSYGLTGPCLRATGADYDVRKDHPYAVYDRFDFAVPVANGGDNLARYLVRVEEIEQSARIIEQALVQIPPGALTLQDPLVCMPDKRDVATSIESMITHFKHVVDGIRVPQGEAYSYTEAANGELGFYIVSDGSGRPLKCRCRPPSFYAAGALREMVTGANATAVASIFDGLNVVSGECDR